jgi:Domain of unknown function (DUF5667)
MNSEKELINQIRTLREIKPDNDWVVSCKVRIMGQEAMGHKPSAIVLLGSFLFQYRAALAAMVLVLGTGGGLLTAAQGALPGEPLYGLKKVTEKGMAVVTGQNNNPAANLLLAAKRLEEIDAISQKNLVKNLPAAFYEYKTAKTAAKKEVALLIKNNPDKAGEIVKEAGAAMKDINDKEKQVYGVLGLEQNASSTQDAADRTSDKEIVDSLIAYFKKSAMLSEEQTADLAKVKDLAAAGNYGQSIDYYLSSSLNK